MVVCTRVKTLAIFPLVGRGKNKVGRPLGRWERSGRCRRLHARKKAVLLMARDRLCSIGRVAREPGGKAGQSTRRPPPQPPGTARIKRRRVFEARRDLQALECQDALLRAEPEGDLLASKLRLARLEGEGSGYGANSVASRSASRRRRWPSAVIGDHRPSTAKLFLVLISPASPIQDSATSYSGTAMRSRRRSAVDGPRAAGCRGMPPRSDTRRTRPNRRAP